MISIAIAVVSSVLSALPQEDESPPRLFGLALCSVGDVDGDGCADLAVVDGTNRASVPAIDVISGRDGSLLCESEWNVGVPIFARCLTSIGDSGSEIALLARCEHSLHDCVDIRIVSPRSGEELRCMHVGRSDFTNASLSSIGDVDGDGRADLVVSTYFADYPSKQSRGSVAVVSSRDGRVLLELANPMSPNRFALDAIGTSDIDGDGRGDLVVSGSYAAEEISWVRWISGIDGALIAEYDAPRRWLGSKLVSVGNGRGRGDLLVNEPRDSSCNPLEPFACVLSPRKLVPLRELNDATTELGGCNIADVGDLNRDGIDDFAATINEAFASNPGVCVFSGVDGSRLFTVLAPNPDDVPSGGFGWAICGAGDTNGDGWNDFAVTTCSPCGPEWPDYLRIYSGRDGALLVTVRPPPLRGR